MSGNGSNSSSTAVDVQIDAWHLAAKLIICIITVFGNALVIYLIMSCKKLRILPNTFIVTLAVADLLVGAIITPTELACWHWRGRCNRLLQILTYDILYHLSATNLCALTIDRYISTSRPLEYPIIMNKTKVIVIVFIAWTSAGVLSLTAYTFHLYGLSYDILQILDLVIFQILLPFSLGIIYVRILCIVKRIKKKENQQIKQINYNYGKSENKKIKASATIKITGAIIVVLILCYILAVGRRACLLFFDKTIPYPVVEKLSRTLLMVNSAANVFVYAFLQGDIKRELKRKLRCFLCLYSNNNIQNSCDEVHISMRIM